MVSELNEHRRDFWQFFAERLPALYGRMVRGNEHSRWLFVGHRPLVIAHYVADRDVGLFVRGPRCEKTWQTREFLFPCREFLAERFGQPDLRPGKSFLLPKSARIDMTDRTNWQAATSWFAENSPVYETIFAELQTTTREDWPDEFPPPAFDDNSDA